MPIAVCFGFAFRREQSASSVSPKTSRSFSIVNVCVSYTASVGSGCRGFHKAAFSDFWPMSGSNSKAELVALNFQRQLRPSKSRSHNRTLYFRFWPVKDSKSTKI